jgi:hypothetical protein
LPSTTALDVLRQPLEPTGEAVAIDDLAAEVSLQATDELLEHSDRVGRAPTNVTAESPRPTPSRSCPPIPPAASQRRPPSRPDGV